MKEIRVTITVIDTEPRQINGAPVTPEEISVSQLPPIYDQKTLGTVLRNAAYMFESYLPSLRGKHPEEDFGRPVPDAMNFAVSVKNSDGTDSWEKKIGIEPFESVVIGDNSLLDKAFNDRALIDGSCLLYNKLSPEERIKIKVVSGISFKTLRDMDGDILRDMLISHNIGGPDIFELSQADINMLTRSERGEIVDGPSGGKSFDPSTITPLNIEISQNDLVRFRKNATDDSVGSDVFKSMSVDLRVQLRAASNLPFSILRRKSDDEMIALLNQYGMLPTASDLPY